MTIADPYAIVANALEQIILAEFAPEGFNDIRHDSLHESLGHHHTIIGISPLTQAPAGDRYVLNTVIMVQFYNKYNLQINPEQAVDPREITQYAERFRRAVGAAHATVEGTDAAWFFNVSGVDYPRDPTGNKSRFEARVQVTGTNASVAESIS